jgi:hypothetical protein
MQKLIFANPIFGLKTCHFKAAAHKVTWLTHRCKKKGPELQQIFFATIRIPIRFFVVAKCCTLFVSGSCSDNQSLICQCSWTPIYHELQHTVHMVAHFLGSSYHELGSLGNLRVSLTVCSQTVSDLQ